MAEDLLPIEKTIIRKYPAFNNDSFIFEMKGIKADLLNITNVFYRGHTIYDYAVAKDKMFKTMDTRPNLLREFDGLIPSCKNIDDKRILDRTNYRVALRNMGKDVYRKIHELKEKESRRLVITFANSIDEYHESETDKSYNDDISCLSQIMIHDGRVTVIYRASDMTNDFFVDFYTILKYVIQSDLFMNEFDLLWVSNTCQFHQTFAEEMLEIERIMKRISKKFEVPQ